MTAAASARSPGRRAALAVAATALVVLLAGIGSLSPFDQDEARYALAVREMAARDEWFVPTNWGEPRYHKPILSYWLALVSERALGPGEFALRLPSVLCGVATVLLTVLLGRAAGLGSRAWRAGLVLATALFFVVETKILTADASLLLATTASFLAWLRLRQAGGASGPGGSASPASSADAASGAAPRVRQTILWLGVGLGLLAKGVNVAFLAATACALSWIEAPWPRVERRLLLALLAVGAVGAVLPGLGVPGAGFVGPSAAGVAAAWFLVRAMRTPEGRAAWARTGWRWGVPLAAGIFALWAVPAALATRGDSLEEATTHHLLGRTVSPFQGQPGWPGYYVVAAVFAFAPWAWLVPSALSRALYCSHRADPREARRSGSVAGPGPAPGGGGRDAAFLAASVVGPWVLLELMASKLPHYLLCSFPALAVLAAREWGRREDDASPAPFASRVTEAVLAGLPSLAIAGVGVAAAWTIRETPVVVAGSAVALTGVGITAWAARELLAGRGARVPLRLAVASGVLYVLVFQALLPAVEPHRIGPRLGAAIARARRPGEPVIVRGYDPESVAFAIGPPVSKAEGDDDLVARLRAAEGSALVVIDRGPADPRFASIASRMRGLEVVEVVAGLRVERLTRKRLWILRNSAEGR